MMYNATRRNRNIGTSKQGYGQNNEMKIPSIDVKLRTFVERIDNYTIEKRLINGNEFTFIVEELREDCYYSCNVNDIAYLIQQIDCRYFNHLRLIVFRQPKRKEQILSSVWGRLIYWVNFNDISGSAIIIEAIPINCQLKWSKKGLSLERQKELNLLAKEGHQIVDDKRSFIITTSEDSVRNTQLYRTFLHELGHYTHYEESVILAVEEEEEYEDWSKRSDIYFAIPNDEKEEFANRFAVKIAKELKENGLIPFDRR